MEDPIFVPPEPLHQHHYVETMGVEHRKLREESVITASEVPCLFRVGYKSPNELLAIKRTGEQREVSQFVKAAMDYGRKFEPTALRAIQHHFRHEASLAQKIPFSTRQIEGVGQIGATPDGILVFNNGETALVEAKCPLNGCRIEADKQMKFWNYAIQMLTQMYCAGYKKNYLVVYHNGEYQLWVVRDSPRFYERMLLPRLREFASLVRDPERQSETYPRAKNGEAGFIIEQLQECVDYACLGTYTFLDDEVEWA